MSALPPETQRGHEFPYSRQFSVFLPNRIGQLKELLDLLTEKEVFNLGLSIVDSADWAVLRMVFDQPDKARDVLRKRGIGFTETAVLLVELAGQEELTRLCGVLLRAEVQIHFAYPLHTGPDQPAAMVIHVDDIVLARQTLTRHGFTLLGGGDRRPPGRDGLDESD